MPLNRKVILDWHTAQRSYNLSLPAEGDVDESQDWCVDMARQGHMKLTPTGHDEKTRLQPLPVFMAMEPNEGHTVR